MKFGLFYLTYNRTEILKDTLQSVFEQTRVPDLTLIVDNANNPKTEAMVRNLSQKNLVYCATGENLGSAGGTSFGVQWLFERGFDWICIGDDDQPPVLKDTFERLMALAQAAGEDVGGVGAVGALWDWNKGELIRLKDEELHGTHDVDFVGGNHLLTVRKKVVERVGTPNSRLFFGYPDLEYCLRIRSAGFRLLVDTDLTRAYRSRFGRTGLTVRRSLLPRRPLNAIWRDYYTTRNYIYMMRTTFGRADLARKAALKALIKTGASLIRGPHYAAAFTRLQLSGIVDGYRNRLGKTIEPVSKFPVP